MNRAKNLLLILTGPKYVSLCITVLFILGEEKSMYLTWFKVERF